MEDSIFRYRGYTQSLKRLQQSRITYFFVWYASVNGYSHTVSMNLLHSKELYHHCVADVFTLR